MTMHRNTLGKKTFRKDKIMLGGSSMSPILIKFSTYRVSFVSLAQLGKIHHHPDECPGYNTKQYDGEAPVMLELWGMQSSPLLPSLPCPLWPRVVALDRVLSMSQIELKCVLMLNRTVLIFKLRTCAKLNCLKLNCFWHWNCTDIKLNFLN